MSKAKKHPTSARRDARSPDRVILDLAEKCAELLAADHDDDPEPVRDRRGKALDRLMYGIINLPADSLAGLRVKTRMLAKEQIIHLDDRVPTVRQAYRQSHRIFDDRLAFSIWADVERLAKEGGAS